MIDYKSLRPGNWIHPTGRSRYVVVTGLLLGMMEKNEDLCKEFEGIELTGELLEAAGFKYVPDYTYSDGSKGEKWVKGFYLISKFYTGEGFGIEWMVAGLHSTCGVQIIHLHHFQNLIFAMTGHELPLPESAKIIPEGVGK